MNVSHHKITCYLGFASPHRAAAETVFASLALPPEPTSEDLTADYERGLSRPVPSWLPERLQPAALGKYQRTPLFEECSPGNLSTDLHLPVRSLLGGSLVNRCVKRHLSSPARTFLSGGQLYNPPESEAEIHQFHQYQLALLLSKRASHRLKKIGLEEHRFFQKDLAGRLCRNSNGGLIIPIFVDEFVANSFSTGRTICEVAISAKLPSREVLPTEILCEMTDHCGRFATLGWIVTPNRKAVKDGAEDFVDILEPERFTVGSLAARFLFGEGAFTQTSQRTFTHTYALVSGVESARNRSELETTGVKLARQYNSDYAIRQDQIDVKRVSEFDNVIHTIALEGVSTVVNSNVDGERITFLEEYEKNSIAQAYKPLILLNLHQMQEAIVIDAKLRMQHRFGTRDDSSTLQDDEQRWEDLTEHLRILSTDFRFHQVSSNSLHCIFNHAMRACLGLDEYEARLSGDLERKLLLTQAAKLKSDSEKRSKFQRAIFPMTILAAAALVGVTVMEFINTFHSFHQDGWSRLEIGSLFLILVFVVAGGYVAWWKLKKRPEN